MSTKQFIFSFLRKQELSNLFVRILTLASRFLLVFFLGKYFTVEEFGIYGLFYTTTAMGLLIIGMDFYNFSNRELVDGSTMGVKNVLLHQLIFYGATYILLLLPFILIFQYEVLPWQYVIVFYCVLVSDHLSQELYRIFTMLKLPVFANLLLLIRNGLWVVLLVGYFFIVTPDNLTLKVVFWSWLGGSLLSVILGIGRLLFMVDFNEKFKLNKVWLKQGIRISSVYLISTLSFMGIERLNRYFLQFWGSLEEVGIFSFYSQFSNAINVFVNTLVIMIIYPKLVEAFHQKNEVGFKIYKKELKLKTIFLSFVSAIGLAIIIHPILVFVDKPEYGDYLLSFYLMILANVFLNISYIYHFVLYAEKRDTKILYATLISFGISLLFNLILIPYFHIMGSAIALLISFGALAITKYIFVSRKNYE